MAKIGSGKNEISWREALCSEIWDFTEQAPARLRYAVFSTQRTGSELLCAYLRQCEMGVPFEYFNDIYMREFARRLGCLDDVGRINVARYISLLEPRRTRHGIFGAKLQPSQLYMISSGDHAGASAFLRRFDKIVLLRRQDKLLQAISLARSHLTNQWHLYGDDETARFAPDDDVIFPMIEARLSNISEEERYMTGLASELAPGRVRTLWYEDFSDWHVLEATAAWLTDGLGGSATPPVRPAQAALPKKLDETEAQEIKRRYLARIDAAH